MTVTILSGHLIGANRLEALFRFGQRLRTFAAAPRARIRRGAAVCVPGSGGGDAVHTARIVRQAAQFLVFACAGIPAQDLFRNVNGAFAGAGATRVSCTVNCTRPCGHSSSPLAWALGNALPALPGIYAAMLCALVPGSAFWYARLYAGKNGVNTKVCENVQNA